MLDAVVFDEKDATAQIEVTGIIGNVDEDFPDDDEEHLPYLIETLRAITYGLCEICQNFPATTHFHHAADGRLAGVCGGCANGVDSEI